MGFNSHSVRELEGRTISGIDVSDGCVYFDVDHPDGSSVEYVIKPFFYFNDPDFVTDIEGDLADLIDSPIILAKYDDASMAYYIESEEGAVYLNADGPDTTFEVNS